MKKTLFALFAFALVTSIAAADEKYVTIKGQIVYNGKEAPKIKIVDVKVDRETCCKDGPLKDTELEIDPKSLGVKNVMVWLKPYDKDRTSTMPKGVIKPALLKAKPVNHVIDQPSCQFEPRVLVAREGDTLLIKNSAKIAHNINFNSDFVVFNVNMPAGSTYPLKKPLELQYQRTPISFKCDVHGWMAGRVRVFDHPYFAITDKDGNFEIKDAPVGNWSIMYQHELGYHKGREGLLGFPLDIKAGAKTLEMPKLTLELPN